MYRIAYVSTATIDFSDDDMSALLIGARASNLRLEVTGSLLYRDGRFVQVIEGPEAAVRQLFERIARDPRHTNIHLGACQAIETRQFTDWTMGYRPLNDTQLTQLTGHLNLVDEPPPARIDAETADEHAETLFDWLYDYWRAVVPQLPAVEVARAAPIGSSSIVSAIFDAIMADVHSGVLLPGDRVSDQSLAKTLGISRTPVREALQRMREIGVVEASPNRFTRIAVVDEGKTRHSIVVLAALYAAVLAEVIGHVSAETIEAMRGDRVAFRKRVTDGSLVQIAGTGAEFYLRLVAESKNDALKRAIQSVVHVVQLGSAHVGTLIGTRVLSESQDLLLEAVLAEDLAEALRALNMLAPGTVTRSVSGA